MIPCFLFPYVSSSVCIHTCTRIRVCHTYSVLRCAFCFVSVAVYVYTYAFTIAPLLLQYPRAAACARAQRRSRSMYGHDIDLSFQPTPRDRLVSAIAINQRVADVYRQARPQTVVAALASKPRVDTHSTQQHTPHGILILKEKTH